MSNTEPAPNTQQDRDDYYFHLEVGDHCEYEEDLDEIEQNNDEDGEFSEEEDISFVIGPGTPIKMMARYAKLHDIRNSLPQLRPHIHDKDYYGITMLHIACLGGRKSIVKYLIDEFGFDPNERDDYGRSAVHWAGLSNNKQLIAYLRNETQADMDALDNENRSIKFYIRHSDMISRNRKCKLRYRRGWW